VASQSGLELSSGQVHNGSGRLIPSSGFGLGLNLAGSFSYPRDLVNGDGPGWTWTSIPPFAKQALYPVELRGHKKSLLGVPAEIPFAKKSVGSGNFFCLGHRQRSRPSGANFRWYWFKSIQNLPSRTGYGFIGRVFSRGNSPENLMDRGHRVVWS
jgi:hypothetical protein